MPFLLCPPRGSPSLLHTCRIQRHFPWLSLPVIALALCNSAAGQLRIANYNCANLNGDLNAFLEVLTHLSEDDKPGFSMAPHALVFQEVMSDTLGEFHDMLDLIAPAGTQYVLGTFTHNGDDYNGGGQALFYRDDLLSEDPLLHADIFTGAGRMTDRWWLGLVGYDNDLAGFYIYSSHLKAGNDSSNEALRLSGVEAVRADSTSLPAGSHIIYAGDMNFYSNSEDGYLHFVSGGIHAAVDPMGTGSWSGAAGATRHTQSPRSTSLGGLIGGGLDDRFDFQFSSSAFHDGEGLSLLVGSYRSVGNDGNHYNTSINDGPNTYFPGDGPRSDDLADALYVASDHVPVMADYVLPGWAEATGPPGIGRLVQGGSWAMPVSIANMPPVIVAEGAQELQYTIEGSGAFSGSFSGSLAPLAAPDVVALPVNTSIVGPLSGVWQVSSPDQGAGGLGVDPLVTGLVVRRSVPSWSDSEIQPLIEVDGDAPAGDVLLVLDIPVHNLGYDDLQAMLDIDVELGFTLPFAVQDPLPTDIGQQYGTITVTFDPSGLTPGTYVMNGGFLCSDEDLPGEQVGSLGIGISITITEGEPLGGDANGDGEVNFLDILAVLSAWGPCAMSCPEDLDSDGQVGFSDILIVLNNWE